MLDVEGVEVTSVQNLRAEVAEAVGEIRRVDTSDWRGWRLEVTDRSGTVLLTINLDTFRPETLAGLPSDTLLLL
jgi:hypothetical protein